MKRILNEMYWRMYKENPSGYVCILEAGIWLLEAQVYRLCKENPTKKVGEWECGSVAGWERGRVVEPTLPLSRSSYSASRSEHPASRSQPAEFMHFPKDSIHKGFP